LDTGYSSEAIVLRMIEEWLGILDIIALSSSNTVIDVDVPARL